MKTVLTDFEILDKSAETLKVLAHPIRLAIIDILLQNESLSVTDIYEILEIEQSVASYHLKNLRMVNLVSSTRTGTKINYTISNKLVAKIFKNITILNS